MTVIAGDTYAIVEEQTFPNLVPLTTGVGLHSPGDLTLILYRRERDGKMGFCLKAPTHVIAEQYCVDEVELTHVYRDKTVASGRTYTAMFLEVRGVRWPTQT